ncbi:N-acetylglucosaminyl-phosphatidylinositol de-N-acetylase isoform X3 [Synchiropus splendidus]|uniref:N-acetylglucosaminyl-phosphatidylinositol de-N-acetylase isoform X3 n=1 Tax=Synchiropus splendidus TaxID=270530 RepID=UPI00237DF8D3|nr:N-acetylglucosaminyl-phosphatidylinositol de-N-acetylase isoform X3 [Synchiropus splendidus]
MMNVCSSLQQSYGCDSFTTASICCVYLRGAQRRQELYKSCAVLGIPASNVSILNYKELPDDPRVEWNISLVSSLIVQYIRKHSINMVLTFDEKGVSGHANHSAIYRAVRHLASSGPVPNDCCLLALTSVGLLRKYISLLELPASWLLPSSLCCIIGSSGYRQARVRPATHSYIVMVTSYSQQPKEIQRPVKSKKYLRVFNVNPSWFPPQILSIQLVFFFSFDPNSALSTLTFIIISFYSNVNNVLH